MHTSTSLPERALVIHQKLIDHYGYPQWRTPLAPLDELVSTILSQNTNDNNRDRAFNALKRRYPTWEAVRDAKLQGVVEAIRPAGLANQKGPRIQNILQEITHQRGTLDLDFLRELSAEEGRKWLLQFKGVGPKTAAIVLQFSLGKPAFPVDTHIHRVSGRIGLRPPNMNAEQAHEHLAGLFSPESYYAAHLNLIRLGREICQARKPLCESCPLTEMCDYYQANKTNSRKNFSTVS
ncbi:MAG: endonuclease III [Anaerolineales bacterium]|nr:endonuclease III [Anaerolineales bacterium]